MQFSLSDSFSRLKRIKNIGIIAVLLLTGVLLCTVEAFSLRNTISDNSLEKKIEELCCELAGDIVYVSVNTDSTGALVGIALILDKEENVKLKLELTEMLSTLYGIPSSRIYVGYK